MSRETNIFFAKNRKQAESYLKKVSDKEGVNWHSPRLARKQYDHVSGYKTWSFKKDKDGCKPFGYYRKKASVFLKKRGLAWDNYIVNKYARDMIPKRCRRR